MVSLHNSNELRAEYLPSNYLGKVEIILKAMAALNLSTKNSNHGREIYLAMIRCRSVNKFLFSVTCETDSKSNMIKYYSFLSFPEKTASADFSSVSSTQ